MKAPNSRLEVQGDAARAGPTQAGAAGTAADTAAAAGAAPWWAHASLAASMAVVGVYVALSKPLVAVFPVALLAWLRFTIAAVAMAGWLRRAPDEPPLSRGDRRLLFWESFVGNFLFSLCMLNGVALAASALAAGVVMAAIPAAVALLSHVFLGERLTRRGIAGIACGSAAVALLAFAGASAGDGGSGGTAGDAGGMGGDAGAGSSGTRATLGVLLLVGAVLCEAGYVVIGKRLAGRVPARRISAIVNLWGLALTTPFGVWLALGFDFAAVKAGAWAGLVAYAIAASMATVWLWMKGLEHVPAATAGVYTVLLPVSAAAVGVLVLGESFGAAHAVAFALAVGGVVLASRG